MILLYIITLLFSIDFEVDFIKANKNQEKFYAVPTNYLIFHKIQAIEPIYFSDGAARGYGWVEPLDNSFIYSIRSTGIKIYVDYFTHAKNRFYLNTPGYEICSLGKATKQKYDARNKKLLDLKFKEHSKYTILSIPSRISPPIGLLGILPEKISAIEKYKFPGTNVYNIKSIVDDPDLYTAQIQDMMVTEIARYIYDQDAFIKKQYKKRVYEFVASNAHQLTLMLRAKRMHYVDLTIFRDFYAKKFNIKNDKIVFVDIAHVHPNSFTDNDLLLSYHYCTGKNLSKLKKVMSIINEQTKNLRTNNNFWHKVLAQWAKKHEVPYQSPSEFYGLSENFKRKAQIDQGFFDNNKK